MNKIITIPRRLVERDDLVIIPRQKYEELLQLSKIPVVKPTKRELQAIRRSKKELRRGEYISWEKLKHELAHYRR